MGRPSPVTFLVLSFRTIAAWRLTREGTVDGVSIDRRAGDSIWTVLLSDDDPIFSFRDQTVAIRQDEEVVHVYCTETGEAFEPTQTLLYHRDYSSWDMLCGLRYFHSIDLFPVMQRGWMKDPEGKHWLWIPTEWRGLCRVTLSNDRKIVRLNLRGDETILIRF